MVGADAAARGPRPLHSGAAEHLENRGRLHAGSWQRGGGDGSVDGIPSPTGGIAASQPSGPAAVSPPSSRAETQTARRRESGALERDARRIDSTSLQGD